MLAFVNTRAWHLEGPLTRVNIRRARATKVSLFKLCAPFLSLLTTMQRPGRSRGSQSHSAAGAGFPDPFGGFGDFGFGSGNSLFENFFNRDPFDDPFFSRPFGSFFGGGLFGGPSPSPFFGGVGAQFGRGFHDRGFLEQVPYNPQQFQEVRRGPVIEEIDDDHPDTIAHTKKDEPIVEHPDDDAHTTTHLDSSSQLNSGSNESSMARYQNRPYSGSAGSHSFSFQSSTVKYGGPSGTYYTSSTQRRAGPNGLIEEQHHEKESSGKETKRVSRGIYDKGRSVMRKRSSEGREETVETLHNLTEEEGKNFNTHWEVEAEKCLSGYNNRNRPHTLQDMPGSERRPRAVLPSTSTSSKQRKS